jgi:phosphatidylglycerophosphate synthase
MTDEPASRRPLSSRDTKWARALATRLIDSEVTPNEISVASVGFAAIGFLFFWAVSVSGPIAAAILMILAAAAIQARLLCNLLDGMVAVEGGKSTATGPFWNEAPDRAADLLFFWGAGLAAGHPALGLGCGALAVATAYLRELGRAEGFPADFSGPMAKQHRMAGLTLACLCAALLPVGYTGAAILTLALWLILAGTAATILFRSMRLLSNLSQTPK